MLLFRFFEDRNPAAMVFRFFHQETAKLRREERKQVNLFGNLRHYSLHCRSLRRGDLRGDESRHKSRVVAKNLWMQRLVFWQRLHTYFTASRHCFERQAPASER